MVLDHLDRDENVNNHPIDSPIRQLVDLIIRPVCHQLVKYHNQ